MTGKLPSWDALQAAAGPPAHRVFAAKERLFGADVPKLKFWHDSAGWCPSCQTVFLVLEEMRLPYMSGTSPLNSYLKPGQSKPAEFLAIRPNGVMPVIQLASSNGSIDDGMIVTNCWRICDFLLASFPEDARMPRTPVRRSYAKALLKFPVWLSETSYKDYYFAPMMDELETLLKGLLFDVELETPDRPWVSAQRKMHDADDADGDESNFGGDIRNGPFLFGRYPCMVDVMLLPWLERAEALRWGGLEPRRWPSVAQMMSAAREHGVCAYSEIGQDMQSLHAISFRRNHKAPPPWDIPLVMAQTGNLGSSARFDAAARVAANFAAIARFALCGVGAGSDNRDAEMWAAGARDVEAAAATEDALRIVAALLVENTAAGTAFPRDVSDKYVSAVCKTHSPGAVKAASAALGFLAWNVAVPRDMTAPSACAMRAYTVLVAKQLVSVPMIQSAQPRRWSRAQGG